MGPRGDLVTSRESIFHEKPRGKKVPGSSRKKSHRKVREKAQQMGKERGGKREAENGDSRKLGKRAQEIGRSGVEMRSNHGKGRDQRKVGKHGGARSRATTRESAKR